MKHSNISIFIPHNGCPHKCSFCNQKNITGQAYQPTASDVTSVLKKALQDLGENSKNAEIAFFGGSFTAIEPAYMISLLDATKPFIDSFYGIRLSTRPDCIDDFVLKTLKNYGVTSIELGAQSMNDEVLLANERGHLSKDVINASKLIKEYGFSLGLQMMTGLYKSNFNYDLETAKKFIDLNPDTVRIYPTIIMKDTNLANLYINKEFVPYTLEQQVELCTKLILLFEKNNINIIRLGLHYSDSLVNNSLGNNYHPAFKELCENKIFYDEFLSVVKNIKDKTNVMVEINPKSLSKFVGQNKCNIIKLNQLGYQVNYKLNSKLKKYELKII